MNVASLPLKRHSGASVLGPKKVTHQTGETVISWFTYFEADKSPDTNHLREIDPTCEVYETALQRMFARWDLDDRALARHHTTATIGSVDDLHDI